MPQLLGFERVPIPGPRTRTLPGTLRRLIGFLDDPVGTVLPLRQYGDVVAVVDQNPAIVCAFGPERVREVLTNPEIFHNPEDFFQGPKGSARDKMRQMVVTSNGERHRRNRRLMMPAMQRTVLDGYAADITELTSALLDRWPIGEAVRADELCREIALCIAVKCFYGIDVKDGARELGRMMAEFVHIITAPLNILLPLNVPGLPYHRGVQLGEELASRMMAIVDEKRRRGGEQRDAMGLMLFARDENGQGLSPDEIVAIAVELFIAGSDTTAMTILWALFLLDQHPSELEQVQAEVHAVLGTRAPTPADLPSLPRVDAVIKEAMRVLPTAPVMFLRAAAQDTTLGGKPIPKRANVLVSPVVAHHDPAVYREPRQFLPERWSTLQPPSYTYFPFGAGPRTCAGAAFATQSTRLVLAMILQRFRLRTVAGSQIDRLTRGNIMHPKAGLHMRLEVPAGPVRAAEPITGNIRDLIAL
jgi:cytochrome P450